MNRQNKIMSISKQSELIELISGALWIAVGVLELFDGTVINILTLTSLLAIMAIIMKVRMADKENDDEMSLYDRANAKAKAFDTMRLIFCLAAIVFLVIFHLPSFETAQFSVTRIIVPVAFFFLGINNFLVGYYFKKMEGADS